MGHWALGTEHWALVLSFAEVLGIGFSSLPHLPHLPHPLTPHSPLPTPLKSF
ncbi:MAG: hypothetical protein V7K27_33865 [Nostoc sp.]|uniref:hypothetical protein n=1 Tax=Nostoc sp. TaxID=1180 RepID=UPI002FF4EFB5